MDNVLKALEAAFNVSSEESAMPELFAKEMAKVVRTLIELGPDEEMVKSGLQDVLFLDSEQGVLNYLASRLEDIGSE